ncbi:hypothetical protein C8F04DRAFT_1143860, partial [Mycena alexandri]
MGEGGGAVGGAGARVILNSGPSHPTPTRPSLLLPLITRLRFLCPPSLPPSVSAASACRTALSSRLLPLLPSPFSLLPSARSPALTANHPQLRYHDTTHHAGSNIRAGMKDDAEDERIRPRPHPRRCVCPRAPSSPTWQREPSSYARLCATRAPRPLVESSPFRPTFTSTSASCPSSGSLPHIAAGCPSLGCMHGLGSTHIYSASFLYRRRWL